MAVNKKGSRKIVVENTSFHWCATGNDGWISVVIWPDENDKVKLIGTFEYHTEITDKPDETGLYRTTKGQIIITNRVIRKIIEHVGTQTIINLEGQTNLGRLEKIYDINSALRVTVDEKREL